VNENPDHSNRIEKSIPDSLGAERGGEIWGSHAAAKKGLRGGETVNNLVLQCESEEGGSSGT